MTDVRSLVVAVTTASLVLLGGLLPPGSPAAVPGSPAAAASERCDGVWVIVDARALGGSLTTRCAPGRPATGLDALVAAGHTYTFVPRFPGMVCTLDRRPDPCNGAPADAYWSYWHAEPGGTWTYATRGAGSRTPTTGGAEGWRFGDGTAPPGTSPPAPPPPPPPPPPPEPAPAPSEPEPTPAPDPPPTTAPSAPSDPAPRDQGSPPSQTTDNGSVTGSDRTQGGTASSEAAPDTSDTGRDDPTTPRSDAVANGSADNDLAAAQAEQGDRNGTDGPGDDGSPTATAATDDHADAAAADPGASDASTAVATPGGTTGNDTATPDTADLGDVDPLAFAADGGGGSAAGTVLGLGLAALLGGAALWHSRRRQPGA